MQNVTKRRAPLECRDEWRPAMGFRGLGEELPARLADEPAQLGIRLTAGPIHREALLLVLLPVEIGRELDDALQPLVGQPRARGSLRRTLRRCHASNRFARTHDLPPNPKPARP